MKSFKQLRESELAKQVLASAKKVSPTAHIDTRSPAERKADTDKMLAARAAAKPKVTNQPSKPSTPEQQMKNQNASMAASYAKHKPGQYVGDSVELEGDSINEDHYERAEDSKTLANTAKNEGDEIGFNSHMADHHDHLSQWHDEKGRASAAQSHADKSEMYANKMTQVAKGVAEASSAGARMQKALQKAKEDRERSERNAERLLNPVKKPVQPEPVKEENLEEGSFKYHMDKAIAAHEKGDDKKKAYHLENARTAKFAMKTADYAKNRELLDKHKQMSEGVVAEEAKIVHTRTGANGTKYHIRQDSANDYSVHREVDGKLKHVDTYGSLQRAKSVLDNEVKEAVHRIGLTVTDPNHPMVSKRKETIQKTVRVTGDDREKAINTAITHHKRKGYKVHDHHYIGTVNEVNEEVVSEEKPGLYANIHAKRKRIAAGSGERMRKPGSKGAPTAKSFRDAQKTVKENIDDGVNEGIARLISKSIKNVTATKKTPQEKADIRLNNLNK